MSRIKIINPEEWNKRLAYSIISVIVIIVGTGFAMSRAIDLKSSKRAEQAVLMWIEVEDECNKLHQNKAFCSCFTDNMKLVYQDDMKSLKKSLNNDKIVEALIDYCAEK